MRNPRTRPDTIRIHGATRAGIALGALLAAIAIGSPAGAERSPAEPPAPALRVLVHGVEVEPSGELSPVSAAMVDRALQKLQEAPAGDTMLRVVDCRPEPATDKVGNAIVRHVESKSELDLTLGKPVVDASVADRCDLPSAPRQPAASFRRLHSP